MKQNSLSDVGGEGTIVRVKQNKKTQGHQIPEFLVRFSVYLVFHIEITVSYMETD